MILNNLLRRQARFTLVMITAELHNSSLIPGCHDNLTTNENAIRHHIPNFRNHSDQLKISILCPAGKIRNCITCITNSCLWNIIKPIKNPHFPGNKNQEILENLF